MTAAPMKPAPTGLTLSCEPMNTVLLWFAAAASAPHPRSWVFAHILHHVGRSAKLIGVSALTTLDTGTGALELRKGYARNSSFVPFLNTKRTTGSPPAEGCHTSNTAAEEYSTFLYAR